MKKLLSALAIGIILPLGCAFAENYDYNINRYDINLKFNKDNTVNVSEDINTTFYRNSRSITRTLNINDYKKNRELHNVETNDIHVISTDDYYNCKDIKIIDTKKQLSDDRNYHLNYDLKYGQNLYSQDFNYDIIDGNWGREIDKVNFKITMPFGLKKKQVEFISSVQGVIHNDNLYYNVLNKTITGHYNKTLLPDEVLTLHIAPKSKNKNWTPAKPNKLMLTNVSEEKITVHANDEVIIRLDSNPSTGFEWQFFVDPDDDSVVSISDELFYPSDLNAVGSNGFSEFRIKALSRGQAEITGVYVRPWMKYEDTSENRVHYSIEVK